VKISILIMSLAAISFLPVFATTVNIEPEPCERCLKPQIVAVEIGDIVTWTNGDDKAHTVTSGKNNTPDGEFDSGLFMAGKSFSHQFDKAGEFDYFCLVHPWLTGTVMVKGEPVARSEQVTVDPTIPLKQRISELEAENQQLKTLLQAAHVKIQDLNAIIHEQVKVIYEFIVSKKQ
jgi:plastocyanin